MYYGGNPYLGSTLADIVCNCKWKNVRYWSQIYVVLMGLRPLIEKAGLDLLSLCCINWKLEKVLSYCLSHDLLGTVDNIRYLRSVWVSYYLQKLLSIF